MVPRPGAKASKESTGTLYCAAMSRSLAAISLAVLLLAGNAFAAPKCGVSGTAA
jgi:hypothetical protein